MHNSRAMRSSTACSFERLDCSPADFVLIPLHNVYCFLACARGARTSYWFILFQLGSALDARSRDMDQTLTPHELATLIRLIRSPAQVQIDSLDFRALAQRGLACIDTIAQKSGQARVTATGHALARRLGMVWPVASCRAARSE